MTAASTESSLASNGAVRSNGPVAPSRVTVDRLWTIPGRADVLLACADRLFAVDGDWLASAIDGGATLAIGDDPAFRVLAAEVESPVRIDPGGAALTFVRRGRPERLPLEAGGQPRRVPTPALPGRTVDAAMIGSRTLVCVQRDETDVDFYRYSVCVVELPGGRGGAAGAADAGPRLIGKPLELSALAPELGLASDGDAALVFDPDGERLWRVGADGRIEPIDLARKGERSAAALLTHATEPWFAVRLEGARDGATRLLQGALNGVVRWEVEMKLPDGRIEPVRCRPGAREIVYVRTVQRQSFVERMDVFGRVQATFELPRATFVTDLAPAASGERVYVATARGLAAVELRPGD